MRASRSQQIVAATSSLPGVARLATGRSTPTMSVNGSALISAIDRPTKRTARAAAVRPVPEQSGQVALRVNAIALVRIRSLAESVSTCMTCLRALQNLPM